MEVSAGPLSEPSWIAIHRETALSYTRPLAGSEILMYALHDRDDGMGDVCFGTTFSTNLEPDTLGQRIRSALCYLRFVAPLLGATIEQDGCDPVQYWWKYTPVTTVQDVERWAVHSLEILHDKIDPDAFVTEIVSKRLPYIHPDGVRQHWRLYLLTNSRQGKFSVFIHGVHAIFDGNSNTNFLRILFEEVTLCDVTHGADRLSWGEEWRNLPPGLVTATGGHLLNWESEGVPMLRRWQTLRTNDIPSRQEVQNVGVIMRICDVLDAATSSRILNGLKTVGHTITRLLEAAFILAMFELNPVLGVPAKDAHVTLDLTFIALTKYLVPPYNRPSHITSTSVVVPLIVPFSTFDTQDGPRAKLCCIMDRLQEEYSHYLSNPHLPHLTANIFASKPLRVPPSETWKNPAALMITNVGLIDGRLPLRYSCSDSHAECHIDVEDVAFSNRWSHSARPLVHMWTMRGKVHFQVIGTDVWDETYMREYLRRAVDLVNTFANDR
ncbi:hypothetical protein IEO21_09665 [Rhodonia placenta]|uniref:Uncharacterized protein n=1 Tax=Rhodonia placenta TaxID=104341 RepID=A0A8H7TY13_9APHY|nr:hypothetical protein IEO21_09665 [Postia placenta]